MANQEEFDDRVEKAFTLVEKVRAEMLPADKVELELRIMTLEVLAAILARLAAIDADMRKKGRG